MAGSVLSVWARVEQVFLNRAFNQSKMQVIRLKTKEGKKIVGTLIPKSCVSELVKDLSSDAEKIEDIPQ